jgi:hypothetical protein
MAVAPEAPPASVRAVQRGSGPSGRQGAARGFQGQEKQCECACTLPALCLGTLHACLPHNCIPTPRGCWTQPLRRCAHVHVVSCCYPKASSWDAHHTTKCTFCCFLVLYMRDLNVVRTSSLLRFLAVSCPCEASSRRNLAPCTTFAF